MFHVSDYFSGTVGTYELNVNIAQNNSVGIDQLAVPTLAVYPNPATDNSTITTGNISGKCTLALIDVLGRTVWTQDIDVAAGAILYQSVANLDNGMYILRLKSGTQTHETKVVVNR
jgi:hypothetical protein